MLTSPITIVSFHILYFIYYMKMKKKEQAHFLYSLKNQNHSNPFLWCCSLFLIPNEPFHLQSFHDHEFVSPFLSFSVQMFLAIHLHLIEIYLVRTARVLVWVSISLHCLLLLLGLFSSFIVSRSKIDLMVSFKHYEVNACF